MVSNIIQEEKEGTDSTYDTYICTGTVPHEVKVCHILRYGIFYILRGGHVANVMSSVCIS